MNNRLARFLISTRTLVCVCAVVTAINPHVTRAGDSGGWHFWPCNPVHRPCAVCPDDYCCKPLPPVCPFCCFGPDCYCQKPLPCTPPFKCCGPDDYCCKPLPVLLPLCPTPDYTCGPPDRCVCAKQCPGKPLASESPAPPVPPLPPVAPAVTPPVSPGPDR